MLIIPLVSLASTLWQQIDRPIVGSAQAIGSFANGCIIGAQPLPLQHVGYQVIRYDQRRYFGHPTLLAFINRLSEKVYDSGLGIVLIGDMSMPAGGRFSSGHVSHQSGLDVDIWLQLPHNRWNQQQLLEPQQLDLVATDGRQIIAALWQPQIATLIKLAAQDSEVRRIFINPAIKKQLCLEVTADRDWLHKVRPWFGHHAHMHVRLRCQPKNFECQDQKLPPPNDGCDAELESWFLPRRPHVELDKAKPPPLFPACQALLNGYFSTK